MVIFYSYASLPEGKPSSYWGTGTLRLQGLQVRARGMFNAWHLASCGRAAEKICGRNPFLKKKYKYPLVI